MCDDALGDRGVLIGGFVNAGCVHVSKLLVVTAGVAVTAGWLVYRHFFLLSCS